jgi:hypothetical protein
MEVKKKKQNIYFTQETEDAINEYNKCEDPVLRNIIYTKKIHPAFYKLAEIMIHRFKFYNFDVPHEDVKHEVVTFLHEKLSKYDGESGFKAFSYFSIVAKNYLIAENNKNYYLYKKRHTLESIDSERNIVNEQLRTEFIDEQKDFIDIFSDIMEEFLPLIFSKNRDLQVADSVLYLFKTRDNIENYNKKALYILIRERTGIKTQYITSVITKFKLIYGRLYQAYNDGKNIANMDWYDIQDIIED